MTEEEAKTKWCPYSRVAGNIFDNTSGTEYQFAGSNRFGHPFNSAPIELQEATRCIASDCMMWAWDKKKESVMGVASVYLPKTSGHCGLAHNKV